MAISSWRAWCVLGLSVLLVLVALLLFRRCERPSAAVLWDSDPRAFAPVGDQCETWSCVPWAVAYGLGSHYAWRADRTRDQQVAKDQFSPSWAYNVFVSGDCHTLMDPQTIFCRLRTVGAASMERMPFGCDVSLLPTPAACEDASMHKTPEFGGLAPYDRMLWPGGTTGWAPVQDALRSEGPLLVLVHVYERFSSDAMNGERLFALRDTDRHTEFLHAMVCVGFDDRLLAPSGARGAFRLRNSWGTCWGEGGSVYVPYADAVKVFSQVWSMHGGEKDSFPSTETCPSAEGDCTGTALATAPTDAPGDPCRCECGQFCAPLQRFRVAAGERILVYGPRIPVVPSLAGAEEVPLDRQAVQGILKPDGPPEADGKVIGARRVGFPYRVVKAPASPLELTVRVLRPLPPQAKGDRSKQRIYAVGSVTIEAR